MGRYDRKNFLITAVKRRVFCTPVSFSFFFAAFPPVQQTKTVIDYKKTQNSQKEHLL